jgi:hypothetical protein
VRGNGAFLCRLLPFHVHRRSQDLIALGWGVDGVTTFPAWISCKDHVEWERILRSKVPAWESEICGPMF